jgi:ABC-type lipoprotein export system ATPase subunit
MVTHDPRFARHADRIVNLFDGRVVEDTAVKSQELDDSREMHRNPCFS